ncbi:hypothetical protein HK098_005537 [Nowakowskiella sp. JEL0407]|nr:hypothetical protein HK098_005537 [Nowakowskiella sp. JEL0407]
MTTVANNEPLPAYSPKDSSISQQYQIDQQIPRVQPATYPVNQQYYPQPAPNAQPVQVRYTYSVCGRRQRRETKRIDRANRRRAKHTVPVFTVQQPQYYPTAVDEKRDVHVPPEPQYQQTYQNQQIPRDNHHHHHHHHHGPHQATYQIPTISSKRPVTMICPYENMTVTTKIWVKPKGVAFLSMGALMFICLPFCWVPFLIPGFYRRIHYCPSCKNVLRKH